MRPFKNVCFRNFSFYNPRTFIQYLICSVPYIVSSDIFKIPSFDINGPQEVPPYSEEPTAASVDMKCHIVKVPVE